VGEGGSHERSECETGEGALTLFVWHPSSALAEPVIGRAFARPVGSGTFSHKGRRERESAHCYCCLILRSALLRASRRMGCSTRGPWFSRRCEASSGDGANAPPHHEEIILDSDSLICPACQNVAVISVERGGKSPAFMAYPVPARGACRPSRNVGRGERWARRVTRRVTLRARRSRVVLTPGLLASSP
jgi:hypothetical protein